MNGTGSVASPAVGATSGRRLLAAAGAVTGLAIAWLLFGPATSGHHGHQTLQPRSAGAAVIAWLRLVAMWQAMMVAMMSPVIFPWLGFVAVLGAAQARPRWHASLGFGAGYFGAWLLYSIGAAAVQLLLQEIEWLDADAALRAPVSGAVFIAAGAFQFTSLKRACLTRCRTPFSHFLQRWRDRPAGALELGLAHGLSCVGCCWALMAVSLAVGVMSVGWMAAIAAAAAVEQLAPGGLRIAHGIGVVLMTWGAVMLLGAG